MDYYHGSQVVFTLLIWVLGIYLLVSARKLQKSSGGRLKMVSFYVLGGLIAFSVVGQLLSYAGANVKPDTQAKTTAQAPTKDELLSLVNAERKKAGVKPLELDSRLNVSAQYKADDMLQDGYYSHIDPVTGKDSHEYIASTGILCTHTSENIAEGSTSKAAVKAWLGSKSHREAILDPRYELAGFGVAGKNKYGYYFFVQHFCDE